MEHLLILASTIVGCVSTPSFTILIDMTVAIANSATTIKYCVITGGIKKNKSIIMKKEKKLDKIYVMTFI